MTYYVMNATYIVDYGRPIVLLFSRDEQRRRVVHRVLGPRPYFWRHAEDHEEADGVDIYGRRIVKVEVDVPWRVRDERRKYPWTCEADVPYAWRVLIDANVWYAYEVQDEELYRGRLIPYTKLLPVEAEGPPPRIVYYDIAVSYTHLTLPTN